MVVHYLPACPAGVAVGGQPCAQNAAENRAQRRRRWRVPERWHGLKQSFVIVHSGEGEPAVAQDGRHTTDMAAKGSHRCPRGYAVTTVSGNL